MHRRVNRHDARLLPVVDDRTRARADRPCRRAGALPGGEYPRVAGYPGDLPAGRGAGQDETPAADPAASAQADGTSRAPELTVAAKGEDTGRFTVERLTLKAVGDTNGYGGPFELHTLEEHYPPPEREGEVCGLPPGCLVVYSYDPLCPICPISPWVNLIAVHLKLDLIHRLTGIFNN
jgi:hypothetical protein